MWLRIILLLTFITCFAFLYNYLLKGSNDEMTCKICPIVIGMIRLALRMGVSKSYIGDKLVDICVGFDIGDRRVCEGTILSLQDEGLTVIDESELSPGELCGLAISNECSTVHHASDMWNVVLPTIPKPPVTPPHPPAADAPTLRILQLTDIHVDRMYKAGSNANCGEPLCCRADNGPPKGDPAWNWGDYRGCDIPPWTLENMFQHLSKNEDFDYVYWTGDLAAHDVWNQTREGQLRLLGYLTSLFQKYLPDKIVLPALGNHDSSPVNSFPPPYITGDRAITWMYDAIAQYWTQWLRGETVNTIRLGAYYTFLLEPGFRVVSINTNYCNRWNWWLLLNTTDPADQLSWLITTLQAAEDNREKVHILGHIPPGNPDCLTAWSWNYYKIVNRYESTITAQFFGHTHHDQFEVFYDEESLTRPTSIAYISPSVTTGSGLNPGYRIYTIDGFHANSTFSVLDHETHILNISAAHMTDKPVWEKEYSAKETYGMLSMFPEDWDKLISGLQTNNTLFDTFYRYRYKSLVSSPCDDKYRKKLICSLRTARSGDPDLCKHLNLDTKQF